MIDVSTFSTRACFELHSNLVGIRISAEDASNFVFAFPERRMMMEIARDVLREHPGVSIDDIIGYNRRAPIAKARHHVWHQIRKERRDIALMDIARKFRRDHQTVIYGIRAHALRVEQRRADQ